MQKGHPVMKAEGKVVCLIEWSQLSLCLRPQVINEHRLPPGINGQGAHNGAQTPPSETVTREQSVLQLS